MAGCFVQKRIQKEILTLKNSPPPGMKLCDDSLSSPGQFMVEVKGAEGTLFAGEEFKLLFKFGQSYPFDSPQVTFVGNQIPVHPHVYSNGHICLSILTEDWSPALSAESVCLSIISMLSSCSEKIFEPNQRSVPLIMPFISEHAVKTQRIRNGGFTMIKFDDFY